MNRTEVVSKTKQIIEKGKFYSKKFAKKLGNQFKYVEGKAPENKMSFKNK